MLLTIFRSTYCKFLTFQIYRTAATGEKTRVSRTSEAWKPTEKRITRTEFIIK